MMDDRLRHGDAQNVRESQGLGRGKDGNHLRTVVTRRDEGNKGGRGGSKVWWVCACACVCLEWILLR